MSLDFLQKLLAQLLDKFKLSNPVLFVVIAAVLSGVKYFIDAGIIPIDEKITGWILWAIAIVLNAGTFNFKNKF